MTRRRSGAAAAVTAGTFLAGWWLTTVASQHPQRAFDRLRRLDPFGLLIPNWRFFAPEPAQHDFHLLHRVLTEQGGTPWEETLSIAPRALSHIVWFPGRRREKGLFDVATHLLSIMAGTGTDVIRSVPYHILRDAVAREVKRRHRGSRLPSGFQFAVVRYSGHDESEEPDYILASPYEPLQSLAHEQTGVAA